VHHDPIGVIGNALRTDGERQELSHNRVWSKTSVDVSASVVASEFNRDQRTAVSRLQLIPQQSLLIYKIP
jgi:hypothetical protein